MQRKLHRRQAGSVDRNPDAWLTVEAEPLVTTTYAANHTTQHMRTEQSRTGQGTGPQARNVQIRVNPRLDRGL